jgi:hypothetical protein
MVASCVLSCLKYFSSSKQLALAQGAKTLPKSAFEVGTKKMGCFQSSPPMMEYIFLFVQEFF